ncbi:hypothetical protein Hamer_G020400 [Homarus americanus]|uniref:Uncharacterized protein n=1 Tax=Homarus americanus TaxID=6706 RepID=A0A8J5MJT6_HOMAM|nr:hypothetical protein Hamer_G020400 [Homarus americanus]
MQVPLSENYENEILVYQSKDYETQVPLYRMTDYNTSRLSGSSETNPALPHKGEDGRPPYPLYKLAKSVCTLPIPHDISVITTGRVKTPFKS